MPQTQISCPRCKQMITANVEQLFDVTADPGAKQRLLGGISNMARCPYCGYEGRLATPIVYHDADKELLLTYFPPELAMPVNEQERLIGPLITQVTNRLPPEKRKAYLFKPVAHLTFESMVETILGKDGITPEMIKAQQERLSLIDRLLQSSTPDVRSEIIKQNARLFDEQFFALFSRLLQAGLGSGQEQLSKQMSELQKQLLDETEYGRQLRQSVGELEAAAKSLQEAGPALTREKLLELIIHAPTDARRKAYVQLARQGLDYTFFQNLTEAIDKSSGDEHKKLEDLREKLLDDVNEIDKQMEARYKQAQEFVEKILAQEDVAKATQDNIDAFSQDAVDVVQTLLRQASEKNDYARMGKLQKMIEILQAASAPPPEVAFIEQLLDAPDAASMEKMLESNEGMINDAFMETLNGLVAQIDAQANQANSAEAKALSEKMQTVYKTALKFSMRKKIR
ncbi:MAG TPA: CpXC domain-containing protein [Anaerolineales bacterium]|nr:CpXC domain-containing protein [Anaerolineales bacterium]